MRHKYVNVPADLYEQVENFIKEAGGYATVSEFIREAIREHLNLKRRRVTSLRGIYYTNGVGGSAK